MDNSVNFRNKITMVNLRTTENIFANREKSTENCLRKFMDATNCTVKCHLQTLNGIPQCLRHSDTNMSKLFRNSKISSKVAQ